MERQQQQPRQQQEKVGATGDAMRARLNFLCCLGCVFLVPLCNPNAPQSTGTVLLLAPQLLPQVQGAKDALAAPHTRAVWPQQRLNSSFLYRSPP